MTKWCAPSSRFERWGRRGTLLGPACPTLLPAGVELVDALAEIFHRARAADLHRGRELAVLDGKIAAQDAVLAYLLERRELFVDAYHRLLDLGDHRRRLRDLVGRAPFPLLHAFQRFGGLLAAQFDRIGRSQIARTSAEPQGHIL